MDFPTDQPNLSFLIWKGGCWISSLGGCGAKRNITSRTLAFLDLCTARSGSPVKVAVTINEVHFSSKRRPPT